MDAHSLSIGHTSHRSGSVGRRQPDSGRIVGNPYLGIISGLPVNLDPIAESKSSFFAAPNRAAGLIFFIGIMTRRS
jgi:hypothetical protein